MMGRIMMNRRVVIAALILSCISLWTIQCVAPDKVETAAKGQSPKKNTRPQELLGPDYVSFTKVQGGSLKSGILQLPEASDKADAKGKWSDEALKRGFVVVGRPTLPLTHHTYLPMKEELDAPVRLTLAAGQTGSMVIFVRSTGKDITLRAMPPSLASEEGYGIEDSYGSRYISLRAVEETRLNLGGGRYLVQPYFLTNSCELSIKANDGGQFWLTIEVPPGTPPGEYRGELRIGPPGLNLAAGLNPEDKTKFNHAKGVIREVILTVPDIKLEESDVAYGTWYHTAGRYHFNTGGVVAGAAQGPAYVLPGSEEIYLADQRRHGMNTLTAYCRAERKDKDGAFHVTFNELDAMVTNVQRAGLCQRHPMILATWRDDGAGGEFGEFAGGEDTVMAIFEHAKKSGWPDILFVVLDEPTGQAEVIARIKEIMRYYEGPRKKGVRTVVADPGPELGHLYDVWIPRMRRSDWVKQHALAGEHNAEVWMYDCSLTGENPLLERFWAGLWTWRTGVKGNMVWSYGWYVRIKETGVPESKLAWEARLAGVNDYQYIHTLEVAIAKAEAASKAGAALNAAKTFLEKLRQRIPYTAYEKRPHGALRALWNPLPEIPPDDYDRIREKCARHIVAIQALLAD